MERAKETNTPHSQFPRMRAHVFPAPQLVEDLSRNVLPPLYNFVLLHMVNMAKKEPGLILIHVKSSEIKIVQNFIKLETIVSKSENYFIII